VFTCSICEKQFQPWSLAFQERRGGKDVCRDCKTLMKQSRSVKNSNKKIDNLVSALENRILSLEEERGMSSFIAETAIKGEVANLDWERIITPILESFLQENLAPFRQELERMQNQLVLLHSRMMEKANPSKKKKRKSPALEDWKENQNLERDYWSE